MRFQVFNFASRSETFGNCFTTDPLQAHGYNAWLSIYPQGDFNASSDVTCSLELKMKENEPVLDADCTFRCGDKTTKVEKYTFSRCGQQNTNKCCISINRHSVLLSENSYLDENGTLTVEVDMDIYVDKPTVWFPVLLPKDYVLSQLYTDVGIADISFLVEKKEHRAHRVVLALRAPVLFELAKDFCYLDGGHLLELPNANGAAFDNIIKFSYTMLDVENAFDNVDITIETLKASDRFGCTDLKLYTESVLVDKFLKAESFSELLLLTDSYASLPLLKEGVLNLYFRNPEACRAAPGWSMVKDSPKLLDELLQWQFQSSTVSCNVLKHPVSEAQIDKLDVTTLREELAKAKLDLDGSREMMVQRLKTLL